MTTLATVLSGAPAISTATAPALGNINSYNASGGALAVTLPALSTLNVGASCVVEKALADATFNAVTFTATSGDTFDDLTTARFLVQPGSKHALQVISISGVKYWKVTSSTFLPGVLKTLASELVLATSTTATDIISVTLPIGVLAAGSTFRIKLKGTVQVQATSGTLTFTPFLQGTALAQTAQLPSQGSAAGPVAFTQEFDITVRTTGATGTAIATPWGVVNLATPVYLASTSTSTTTVDTSAAAASNVLKVQAQWATSSATNSLKVETATIERIA